MLINRNIGQVGLGDLNLLVRVSVSLGECPDMHGHGGAADPGDVCITVDDITDKYGFLELKGIDSHGHRASLGAPAGYDTAGNIDL